MDQGWHRLGARIKAERSRRWATRRAFAAATGVSIRVLADLENGARRNFTPETIALVEAALGWESGDADRVRDGLEPNRQHDPGLTRLIDLWPDLSPETRRALVLVAEDSVRPK